jgi:hypothetical protein
LGGKGESGLYKNYAREERIKTKFFPKNQTPIEIYDELVDKYYSLYGKNSLI